MASHLDYYESTGVLHLHYDGHGDVENRLQLLDEVLEHAKSRNIRRILVDARRMPSNLPILDLHIFGKKLAAATELAGSQIALVCDKFDDDYEYVALVAQNRGAQIQTFSDAALAHQWLSK